MKRQDNPFEFGTFDFLDRATNFVRPRHEDQNVSAIIRGLSQGVRSYFPRRFVNHFTFQILDLDREGSPGKSVLRRGADDL